MRLSKYQQLTFDKYKLGENIFITGAGGTGKTKLIREIYLDAINNKKKNKCMRNDRLCSSIITM